MRKCETKRDESNKLQVKKRDETNKKTSARHWPTRPSTVGLLSHKTATILAHFP